MKQIQNPIEKSLKEEVKIDTPLTFLAWHRHFN